MTDRQLITHFSEELILFQALSHKSQTFLYKHLFASNQIKKPSKGLQSTRYASEGESALIMEWFS